MVVASFGYKMKGLLLTALKFSCISFIRDKLAHFWTFAILLVYFVFLMLSLAAYRYGC